MISMVQHDHQSLLTTLKRIYIYLKKKKNTEVRKRFLLKLYMWENLILFLLGIWQHCKDELLTQENSVSGNILLRKQCIPKKSLFLPFPYDIISK